VSAGTKSQVTTPGSDEKAQARGNEPRERPIAEEIMWKQLLLKDANYQVNVAAYPAKYLKGCIL
jgi:hypothetical protein